MQKLKAKEEMRSRTAKVSGREKKFDFGLDSCRGDDVMQNVSSARGTQLFLARK